MRNYLSTSLQTAVETETRERLCKMVEDKYPAHTVAKKAAILQRIRSVKESEN
jgi:Xaa-Pro aminopeptidase